VVLKTIVPTAVLLNVDETILNLPWSSLGRGRCDFSANTLRRLVTTRVLPTWPRPLKEDNVVRILAVANPSLDLAAGEREIEALRELEGTGLVRHRSQCAHTRKRRGVPLLRCWPTETTTFFTFRARLVRSSRPGDERIRFPTGCSLPIDVLMSIGKLLLTLCSTAPVNPERAAGGKRSVETSHQQCLAAAFIAAGASAYAAILPVTETGASLFTKAVLQNSLPARECGLAFLEARKYVVRNWVKWLT